MAAAITFTSISDDAWVQIEPHLPPGAPRPGARQLLEHICRCYFERPPDLKDERRKLEQILDSMRRSDGLITGYNGRSAYLRVDLDSRIPVVEAELARIKACKTPEDRLYFAVLATFESWGGQLAEGESDYPPKKMQEFFNSVLEAFGLESLSDSTLRGVIRRYKNARQVSSPPGFVSFAESHGF
jgi:hypothetical protein